MLAVIVLLGYWAGFGLTRRQVKADARAAGEAEAEGATGHPWVVGRDYFGSRWHVDGVVGGRLARGGGRAGDRALDTGAAGEGRPGSGGDDRAAGAMGRRRANRRCGAGRCGFPLDFGHCMWSAAAWAGWWLYARQRTLVAFLPAGVLLAANAYYYWDGRFWLPLYLGMVTLVAVLTNRCTLERRWQRLGMDYSEDVRMDMILSALAISLLVTSIAFVMPRVVIGPTANWFEGLTAAPMDKLGEAGKGLFPGLRRTPRPLLAEGGSPGGMPRSYLLGSGPELSQELVMRVSTDELAALRRGSRLRLT